MTKADAEMLKDLSPALDKAARIFLGMMQGNLESARITPVASRGEVHDCFNGSLGQQGKGLMAALQDFEERVLPHSLALSNPMYMGLVNSSPLPGAALMDCLVSALDNNAGASHQGPAAHACEEEVVRSLSEMLGLAPETTGLFQPGGTYANLHGLLLARQASTRKHGASVERLTLYYSQACHFSITRGAHVIGLSPENLRAVPVKGRGCMDTSALDAMIASDKAAGLTPCAVVCNLGSTGTGALDPVAEVISICHRHAVWCHVDACIGGPILLMDEFSDYRESVAQADSMSVDLHKWFFMPLTASLVLTRHSELETACFQLEASYIPKGTSEPYQRGLATSRRATGLTVWLALRAYGWDTISEAVGENIRLTRLLEGRLKDLGFTVLPDGELSVCCARLDADDLPPGFHDTVAQNIREQGAAWFATVRHDGHDWWRFNILNLYADESHVLRMSELLMYEVALLRATSTPPIR